MGEAKATEKAQKKSWFAGLQAEFKKIIWPDRKSITKQTMAVVMISVFLGAIIKILDMLIQMGLNLIA